MLFSEVPQYSGTFQIAILAFWTVHCLKENTTH